LGNDTLDGSAGIDTASYASATAAITVNLALTSAQNTGAAGTDTLTNVENLTGSAYHDSLTGSTADNVLTGGAGNDTIDGGTGDDLAIISGPQSTYRFGLRDGVLITRGADGVDQFVNIESLKWSNTAEISIASLAAMASNLGLLYVSAGDGTFNYRLPDAYTGPLAGVVNQALGSAGSDIMLATALADYVNAGGGDDAIDGGAGNDVIDGGLGSNFISGGAGQDSFFVDGRATAENTTWSTITDFSPGEHLTLWGYQPGVSTMQWVESAGAEGYTGATLHCDLDGNGVIDTSITFTGLPQEQVPTPIYGADCILFG
jgi:serralysin